MDLLNIKCQIIFMKDICQIIKNKVQVKKYIKIKVNMWAILKMTLSLVLVNMIGQIIHNIKVVLKMI